ncbi:MAG: hypothetical protein ACOC46_02435, partial [Pirellulales bacterium]
MFDLDDTLHSVRRFAVRRLRAVAERAAADHPELDRAALFHALRQGYDETRRGDLIETTLRHFGRDDPRYVARLVDLYREIESDESLYPD